MPLNALLIQEPWFSFGSRPPVFQSISMLVPGAVGEVVPQNGRRCLRLVNDAERHVGLSQPHQSLFDMARRLILRNDNFEAVDSASVILLFQIVAADLHFLAGKLVTGNVYLLLGTGGVFAARIFPDDFIKRGKRLLGA